MESPNDYIKHSCQSSAMILIKILDNNRIREDRSPFNLIYFRKHALTPKMLLVVPLKKKKKKNPFIQTKEECKSSILLYVPPITIYRVYGLYYYYFFSF
jgi:hypothetical protein